jgi:predicted GH43/DUF377 family glycosyl hydrolase
MTEHEITTRHDGRRAFNASICEGDDRLLMAYRVSYEDSPDRLRFATLDRDLNVLDDVPLVVPLADGWGAEDPRLFEHDGLLYVAWTAANYASKPWNATMFYGVVTYHEGKAEVIDAYQPRFGLNTVNQREKNWQFWSHNFRLFAQYQPSPHHIIELDGETVVNEWKTDGFSWDHGKPSGGTPPILNREGNLLSFFHSWSDHPTNERIYHFGAMEMEPVAPFRVLRVSSRPILSASSTWPLPRDRWKPLCVFPCGAIRRDNGNYLVSCGVNDNGIRIFDIAESELGLTFPVFTSPESTRLVKAVRNFMFAGRLRQVGEVLEVGMQEITNLTKRNLAEPYETQDA